MKREMNKHNQFYVDKAVAQVKETEELKKSVEEDLKEKPKQEVEKAKAKVNEALKEKENKKGKEVVHLEKKND
jgi:hypothetical protein